MAKRLIRGGFDMQQDIVAIPPSKLIMRCSASFRPKMSKLWLQIPYLGGRQPEHCCPLCRDENEAPAP